jgi:peroxiredoxin
VKLQEKLQSFQEHNAEIWVISPDPADKLEAMREKHGLTFPTLMDPDLAVVRSYGILNEKSSEVPHPTALVIDQSGKVTYVRVDENYAERPEPDELLDALHAEESMEEGASP